VHFVLKSTSKETYRALGEMRRQPCVLSEFSRLPDHFRVVLRDNRSTMANRLLVLASLLAVILVNTSNVDAFHGPHGEADARVTWKSRHTTPATASSSDVPGMTRRSKSPSSKFKNIEEMLDTFRAEPVLVSFTSGNCGPCKLQKKELATVSQVVGSGFKMFAIDTEKWPNVGSRFKIGTLPCLVVVKEGEVLLRLEGLTLAEDILVGIRPLYGLAA
jgi:thioredoxin 1